MAYTFRMIRRDVCHEVELRDSENRITLDLSSHRWDARKHKKLRAMGIEPRDARRLAEAYAISWLNLSPRDRYVRALTEARDFAGWCERRHHHTIRACAAALEERSPAKIDSAICDVDQTSDTVDEAATRYNALVDFGWLILDYRDMDNTLDQLRANESD